MAKKIYICKGCGEKFYSYKDNAQYCSRNCKSKHTTFDHNCDYCGKPIKVYKYLHDKYISGEQKHLYCSKECTDKGQITRVTRICLECGKSFETEISRDKKYCSEKCYQKWRADKKKLFKKICPICNKSFETYSENKKYCSKECQGMSRRKRVTCKCDKCGKDFERKQSDVINAKKHYCSKECMYDDMRWCISDIEVLRNNYRKIPTKDIQNMLSKHYSVKAIRSYAVRLGLAKTRIWSEEERQILIDNYEIVPMCDILKLLPRRTIPSIVDMAGILHLTSYFNKNRMYTKEDDEFLKSNYLQMSNFELSQKLNRTEKAIEQRLYLLSLYRPREIKKDGYIDLCQFMRARLYMWANEVRKQNNYTCCVSGKHSNLIIHHCRSFNLLFNETIDTLDFPIYDNFEQYTDKELLLFVETFFDLQEYYHEYVCINEEIHILFHKNYGYGDNTQEQWEEFVAKYKSGYYD